MIQSNTDFSQLVELNHLLDYLNSLRDNFLKGLDQRNIEILHLDAEKYRNIENSKEIGKGTFGIVYPWTDPSTQEKYAFKYINIKE